MRNRVWIFLVALAAVLAGAAGWAWSDRCGDWTATAPFVMASGTAEGPLRAGAARVAINPPFPVVVAGYAPPRPEASRALQPLQARALVLEIQNLKVAIVSVDLLFVPMDIANRVRERVADLGVSELWVAATHAHSSFGGYDARLVSEIAGTGAFRVEARAAVVEASVGALRAAASALKPAELEIGAAEHPELSRARTGTSVDPRITRVRVRSPDGSPIAEMWVLAAHPTLAQRERDTLSPDYPGLVDSEAGPVILVLQGALGNATAVTPDGAAEDPIQRFAGAVRDAFHSVAVSAVDPVTMSFSRVGFGLPRPDARRLVPAITRSPVENLLCSSAERTAVLSALRVGPVTWLAMPLEPTADAARALEATTGARPVALVSGYLGYLDDPGAVSGGVGESRRQYFGPQLLEAVQRAGSLATSALGRR